MQMFRRGKRHQQTQSALTFYLLVLVYMAIVSLLYMVSFAPLLALFFGGEGSALQYLALLCPLLVLFLLLPLRFSFAQALSARMRREPFSLKIAFNLSLYGEKLAEGVLYVLHLIKWTLPLAAACGALYYFYYNTEAFTLIKGITDFGVSAAAVWNGVLHFIGISTGTAAAGIAEGAVAILAVLGICLLLLMIGIMRNSAYRYIWADATVLDKNPHFEARRSLRGRRFQQLGVALINLVLLLPALIVLYRFLEPKQTIAALAEQYADALVSQTDLPAIAIPYGNLAIVFFACYLPLLPLRRMITAFFATARIRRLLMPQETAPVGGAALPPLYEDKPGSPAGRHS